MLEALLNELRNLYKNHPGCHGEGRGQAIQMQAKHACAFARKNRILITPEYNFVEIEDAQNPLETSLIQGAEHVVEFDINTGRMKKFTIPSGFGLTPKLIHHEIANANFYQNLPHRRVSIEFEDGSPLEYLIRWKACNELFGDDVRLTTVIQWPNGEISFGITQPQYSGHIPCKSSIEHYFSQAGWTRITNELCHTVFYNYAYDILALDIEPRNCYISENGNLLPFDVILSKPNERLSRFLNLYPSP